MHTILGALWEKNVLNAYAYGFVNNYFYNILLKAYIEIGLSVSLFTLSPLGSELCCLLLWSKRKKAGPCLYQAGDKLWYLPEQVQKK